MAGKNYVRFYFEGDAQGLKRATRSADRDLANLNASGKKHFGGFAKEGLKAGAALLGAGGLLVGLKATVQAAEQQQAANAKLQARLKALDISYEENGAHIDEVLKKQEKLSGFTRSELTTSFTNLVTTTHDVKKALGLTSLAMDVARARHVSLTAASLLVTKAAIGQVGALRRLGIDVQKVTTAEDALHKSGEKTTFGQRQAAKAADEQATKQQLLATLQTRFAGQAEAYGKTAAGAQDRMREAVNELEVSIGQKLLPHLTNWINDLTSLVGWTEKHSTETKIILGLLLGGGGLIFAINLMTKVTTAWRDAQILLDAALTANPIGAIIVAIAALAAGFVLAYEHSKTFRSIVKGGLHEVAAAAEFVKQHWMLFLAALTGGFGPAVVEIIRHAGELKAGFVGVVDGIRSGFNSLWKWLETKALETVLLIVEPFSHLPGGLGSWARRAKDSVNAQLDQIHPPEVKLKVSGGQFSETITDRHGHKDVISGKLYAGPHAGGGRIKGGTPGRDDVVGLLSSDEFVVTGGGERLLESMTFPGVLNWLERVQPPHFAFGGRVANAVGTMASGSLTQMAMGPGLLQGFAQAAGFGPPQVGAGLAAPSGRVREWLTQALKVTGHYSPANLNALYGRAMQESGGNPRAINLWDINAQRGDPSKGLLQTTGSTFASYHLPGHNDIWNPVDNAIAALRYMFARYGHVVGPSSTGYRRGGRIRRGGHRRPPLPGPPPPGQLPGLTDLPLEIEEAIADAELTTPTVDDIAAYEAAESFYSGLIGPPSYLGPADRIKAKQDLKGVRDTLAQLRGAGAADTSADLQAQLAQEQARNAVLARTAGLDEAFIASGGVGSPGPGPSPGPSPAGHTIVIQSLVPPDPQWIAAIGRYSAEGAGMQPYRTTSVENLGV